MVVFFFSPQTEMGEHEPPLTPSLPRCTFMPSWQLPGCLGAIGQWQPNLNHEVPNGCRSPIWGQTTGVRAPHETTLVAGSEPWPHLTTGGRLASHASLHDREVAVSNWFDCLQLGWLIGMVAICKVSRVYQISDCMQSLCSALQPLYGGRDGRHTVLFLQSCIGAQSHGC